MNLGHVFGFKFLRNEPKENNVAIIPQRIDGASVIENASFDGMMGHTAHAYDMEATYKDENELINRYRTLSLYSEVDSAVQDIVNEAISEDEVGNIVMLDLAKCEELPESIKEQIDKEFKHILDVLQFDMTASDYFRQWYVEGRLGFQVVIDSNNPQAGIQELRQFDATSLKKVNEVSVEKHPETGVDVITDTKSYFIYKQNPDSLTGIKLSEDTVVYATSGLTDASTGFTLSHIHKAIRPANQLRMLEDANIIYFMSRAPERRIFYIDVGGLPKSKADEYVRSMMNNYRNKQVYDAKTGEIKDSKQFLSMQEDYWMPRRDGKGTEITTLAGGQGLTQQLESIEFFRKKLYSSLNIPMSRFEAGAQYNVGRATEITRDEIKFAKFIDSLRRRFSQILTSALRVQCLFRGIMTLEDWDRIESKIEVVFAKDNHFAELKELDVISSRLEILDKISPYIGKHYSQAYVDRHILGLTDIEIEEMQADIANEGKKPSEESADTNSYSSGTTFGGSSNFEMNPMDTGFEEPSGPEQISGTPEALPLTPELQPTVAAPEAQIGGELNV